MKINRFLKVLFSFLLIGLLLYACRQENFLTESQSNKSMLVSKIISLRDSKHISNVLPEISKAKEILNKSLSKGISGKVINFGDSITIDTEKVVYIENGPNYHTYTFNVIRTETIPNAPIENLILTPLPDGTYMKILATYNLSDEEKEQIRLGNAVDTKGKVKFVTLDKDSFNGIISKSENCGFFEIEIIISCSENKHGSWNQDKWDECTAKVKPQRIIVMQYKCESLDDGSGAYSGGGNGGVTWDGLGDGSLHEGDGTGNGTGSGGCSGTGVFTEPTDPTMGFADGCNDGVPTLVNLDDDPKPMTPCEKLSDLINPTKANIKPLITNGMYSYIDNSSTGEGGISLKLDDKGLYTSDILPYTPGASSLIKTGGRYYSAIHTHPKTAYPMFSWSDVYSLYKLEMSGATYNNGKSSFLLVCEDDNGVKQTYAIVFENIGLYMEDVFSNPENIGCNEEEIVNQMDKKLEIKYNNEESKSNPNYERVFLQFNFGTNIGLYKANNDLSNWSKLSINENSDTATVNSTNCN